MTQEADRKSAGEPSGKPAASLLTIPIFNARPSRHVPRPAPSSGPDSPAPTEEPPSPSKAPSNSGNSVAPAQRFPETSPVKAGPSEAKHLRQYWRRIASGGVPPIEELDTRAISRNWPYTLLIRVPDDELIDIVHVYAPEPGEAGCDGEAGAHPLAQDHYSQLSAWVLRLARETAPTRGPSETTESFPMAGGMRRFTAQAMPCQSRNDSAAYVLLNISRS